MTISATALNKQIRIAIRQDQERVKAYFAKYRKTKKYKAYHTNWQAEKRAQSVPFTITGYYHPRSKTFDITEIKLGKRRV